MKKKKQPKKKKKKKKQLTRPLLLEMERSRVL